MSGRARRSGQALHHRCIAALAGVLHLRHPDQGEGIRAVRVRDHHLPVGTDHVLDDPEAGRVEAEPRRKDHAGIPADHGRGGQAPEPLGRRIDEGDDAVLVHEHHGIRSPAGGGRRKNGDRLAHGCGSAPTGRMADDPGARYVRLPRTADPGTGCRPGNGSAVHRLDLLQGQLIESGDVVQKAGVPRLIAPVWPNGRAGRRPRRMPMARALDTPGHFEPARGLSGHTQACLSLHVPPASASDRGHWSQ